MFYISAKTMYFISLSRSDNVIKFISEFYIIQFIQVHRIIKHIYEII